MHFTKINSEEFEKEVLTSKSPVLLEFSYDYCLACQEVKKFIINNLDLKDLKLVEIDISKNQSLARNYNVDKSPTLLLFNNGRVIARHIGYLKRNELNTLLNNLPYWTKVGNKIKQGGKLMFNFLFGRNKVENISATEVAQKLNQTKPQIIDVRTKREYQEGHIPNSINIPVTKITDNLDKLAKEEEIITVCASGRRSKKAAKKLVTADYNKVKNMSGGMNAWQGDIIKNN
ncbi:thioredoxin domain-containing protein [Natroniella sulfidigena]|uniref:rhodanese-like domain-containing protein n=1 Tax=Natroniella sulfidigena TaxID=723921 RepID=UPI00200B0261|nr:rhodanese-like domain-containing protein [Natroniella sulfidigena]MCK8817903.1 thioredoxin domain-containing protein [Natroniella sulfidigena]